MTQSTRQATLRSRLAQGDRLALELAQLSALQGLEQHPFARRWVGGALTAGELQVFAAEHHHVVVALEDVARRAAAITDGMLAELLTRYAEDQDESIGLSCEFAAAAGWGRSAWYFACDPLPETVRCARALRSEARSLAEHLVTIHTIESTLAVLAPGQLAALSDCYGFDTGSVRYFARRAERSADDAALCEAALTSLVPIVSPDSLVRHAEMCHRAYRELLDGVQLLSPPAS